MSGNTELLNFVYQNSQMGMESLSQLLEIAEDEEFRSCMEKQLDKYREFHNEAKRLLQERGHNEKSLGMFDKLKTYLMTGNRAGIQKLIFETIGLARCSEREWTLLEVKQTVRQVVNLIMFYTANEKQENGEGVSDTENIADILDKNVERLDVKNLCESIEEVVDYMICGKELAATDSMKDIVHRAAAYVDSHYAEELTLTSLAERYHVESTYFSRMFRQETGKNLILYITDKRIEKAREYIEKTDMNLTEAAFLVGYDDYTYFSRVFKKYENMTVKEYKNKIKK